MTLKYLTESELKDFSYNLPQKDLKKRVAELDFTIILKGLYETYIIPKRIARTVIIDVIRRPNLK